MRTTRSSSHPGGGVCTRHPSLLLWPSGMVAFWYGGLLVWCLLVWWPSVTAFCYGLLPPKPYQEAIFNQKATKPEGHQTRRYQTRRSPNQKVTKPEGHQTRRPQQKAITEGHTPWDQAPPRADPQAPPGTRHPPAARHAGIPPAMHAGMAPPL